MEKYKQVGDKKLRYGYTTGSTAYAATMSAAKTLITKEEMINIKISTPKGWDLLLDIHSTEVGNDYVECSVRKDAGDDPDVTDKILIYSKVTKIEKGVIVDGGVGVGRVTKKGLTQKIGEAAINETPKRLMEEGLKELIKKHNLDYGLKAVISVPEGEEVSKQTFNPNLGILGGISIIGTSGIVEPMSEKAIIDSIKLEVKVRRNESDIVYLSIGNYGSDYFKKYIDSENEPIKVSNFIGDALESVNNEKFKELYLIGHIGKIVKIAAGIMNTHSKNADARMEILSSYAALYGADSYSVSKILSSVTTDSAIDIIKELGILEHVMNHLVQRVHYHIKRKTPSTEVKVLVFSNVEGVLSHINIFKEDEKSYDGINIIGMGPGHYDYVISKAWKYIKSSDVIIGAKRHIDSFDKEKVYIEDGLKNIISFINENYKKKNISVLVSGDSSYHSLLGYLSRNLDIKMNVISGISSYQYLYSKIKREYNNVVNLSLHGQNENYKEYLGKKEIVLLLDKNNTPKKIAEEILNAGYNPYIIVGTNLSYKNELIIRKKAMQIKEMDFSPLSIMVIENE